MQANPSVQESQIINQAVGKRFPLCDAHQLTELEKWLETEGNKDLTVHNIRINLELFIVVIVEIENLIWHYLGFVFFISRGIRCGFSYSENPNTYLHKDFCFTSKLQWPKRKTQIFDPRPVRRAKK